MHRPPESQSHNSVRRGAGLVAIRERLVRCLRVVSAQHGHRVGSRVRDPRPVRVLFGYQQGPGASRVGGADQCVVDVADHIPVSVFKVELGVSDAAKRAIS